MLKFFYVYGFKLLHITRVRTGVFRYNYIASEDLHFIFSLELLQIFILLQHLRVAFLIPFHFRVWLYLHEYLAFFQRAGLVWHSDQDTAVGDQDPRLFF